MITSLKKLFALISRKDKVKMGFLVFLMICSTLLEMIGIGAIPAFVYLLSNPDKFFDTFNFLTFLQLFYEQDPAKFFGLTLFFLILIYLVKNIFISLVQLFKTRLSYKQQIKARKLVISK